MISLSFMNFILFFGCSESTISVWTGGGSSLVGGVGGGNDGGGGSGSGSGVGSGSG